MKPETKIYITRDPERLEPYYTQHVLAMTAESLHAKSDIAAELAARDARIAELEARCAVMEGALDAARQYLEFHSSEGCEPVPLHAVRAALADDGSKMLAVLGHARTAYKEIDAVISESRGVDGLHLNGDIASWDEFEGLLASVHNLGQALADLDGKENEDVGA